MIERRVSLSLPHRVFFTEGVFDPAQTLLRDVLCPAESLDGRVRRVLIVLEEAVADGQAGLEGAIRNWFAAQDGLLVLSDLRLIQGGEPCKNDWSQVERLWSAIHRNLRVCANIVLVTRDDTQYNLALGVSYSPAKNWKITPQVSLINNKSNIQIFEYRREIYSVTVRREL